MKRFLTSKTFLKWLTLFIPMYTVTATVITVETGCIVKGLFVGLLVATIKTIVGSVHHSLWGMAEANPVDAGIIAD